MEFHFIGNRLNSCRHHSGREPPGREILGYLSSNPVGNPSEIDFTSVFGPKNLKIFRLRRANKRKNSLENL